MKPTDDLSKLQDVANRAAGLNREEANRKAAEANKKEPRPIPVPNARKWLDKIKRSEKIRKPFREEAERYMRYYQGDYSQRPHKKRTYETMNVNFVYAHIEIITPAVFNGFPYIRVRPKPKANESVIEAEKRARNMELVINYWFKELAVDEELKDAFFDWFFGYACIELGWETEVEEREEVFTQDDGSEGKRTTVVKIKDKPFIKREDPWTIFFDPDARRRRDVRWIGKEEVMLYNDFLASPKFTEKAKKYVKPQCYPIEVAEEKNWLSREDSYSDKEWVQIYTIWDKDSRRVFSVTKGYKGFLNSDTEDGVPWPMDIEYKSDPYPFCILDGKKDRVCPYTWSEFKAYEAQIIEQNRIRSAMQIHVKRTLPKYIYTSAAGDRHKISKLMNARSDEAVELDNLDAFRPLEEARIPPDLITMNTVCKDDMTNVSGLSEYYNQGLANTATEAQLLEGKSQVRKSAKSKSWEQYVVDVAGKLSQLCQYNMSDALAVQIAGPNGIEWLNLSKEDIKGEFYFDIEPGIMEYKNEALRKQQLLKFAEITNGDPNVNRRAIVGKIAKELDMVPEDVMMPEDKIPGPPPPEPLVKIKDIDPMAITNEQLKVQLVLQTMAHNGIQLPPNLAQLLPPSQPAPPPQEDPGAPGLSFGGKDIANAGLNPNGNQNLPPVTGNMTEGFGV